VSERIDEFPNNTSFVLVTFTSPENLASYQAPSGFTVLLDEHLSAYSAFGLGRGSVPRIYGLNTMRGYVKLFRRNGFSDVQRPTDDTFQLGGDFVIDPEGILRYSHWASGPNDRPSIDALIYAAKTATL